MISFIKIILLVTNTGPGKVKGQAHSGIIYSHFGGIFLLIPRIHVHIPEIRKKMPLKVLIWLHIIPLWEWDYIIIVK